MKKLTYYYKNGYNFDLVERNEDFGIYVQYKTQPSKSNTYEVIFIKKFGEREIFGNKVEPCEASPSNEEWGKLGKTVIGLDRAREVMAEMEREKKESAKKYEEMVAKTGRRAFEKKVKN